MHEATEISRVAIHAGLNELQSSKKKTWDRIRLSVAGRKFILSMHPELEFVLDRLVDPSTRGDPESPLRWTCKSLRKLASELILQNLIVSRHSVAKLLEKNGYSFQGNSKTIEGRQHPDRDSQFVFIDDEARKALERSKPFVSIDTEKKENIGCFEDGGREGAQRGSYVESMFSTFPMMLLEK